MNIFPRLSTLKNKKALAILQSLLSIEKQQGAFDGIETKTSGLHLFDQQIENYEAIIYGEARDALLKSQTERFSRCQKRKLPIEVIITAADALFHLIQVLHDHSETLTSRLAKRSHRRDDNIKALQAALGVIEELKVQLLREAAVLQAVLASRLNAWYQGETELQYVRSRRYAHGDGEQAACFSEMAASMNQLQTVIGPYQQAHYQGKQRHHRGNTVYQHLHNDILSMSQRTMGALASITYQPMRQMMKSTGADSRLSEAGDHQSPTVPLSLNTLNKLEHDQHSWWKGVRYRAKLNVLHLHHQRDRRVYTTDYQARWVINHQVQHSVQSNIKHLNWLWHYKTRKLYKGFQKDLQREQHFLARQQLKAALLSLDEAKSTDENISAWLAVLPSAMSQAWQQLITLCQQPALCTGDRLPMAIAHISQLLHLTDQQQEALLTRVIEQFIVPAVESTQHPAYPLLYHYHAKAAHAVLKPQWQDMMAHLRDEAAWQSVDGASEHLSFLLTANKIPTVHFTAKVDVLSKLLLTDHLLGEPVSITVWQHLQLCAKQLALPAVIHERCDDVNYWMQDQSQSLAHNILAALSLEQVQPLKCAAWEDRVEAVSRLMGLLNSELNKPLNPQFDAAQALFTQITERLLILAEDFYVFRVPNFKQLLHHCIHHPVLVHSSLPAKLRVAVNRWTTPRHHVSVQPTAERADADKTAPSVQVMKKIKTAVGQLLHVISELSRDQLTDTVNQGLPCRLTRAELMTIAECHIDEHDDQQGLTSLTRQLHVLSESPFVHHALQRQCKQLICLFTVKDHAQRQAAVDAFLQGQSQQATQRQGFFAANDAKSQEKPAEQPSVHHQYQ